MGRSAVEVCLASTVRGFTCLRVIRGVTRQRRMSGEGILAGSPGLPRVVHSALLLAVLGGGLGCQESRPGRSPTAPPPRSDLYLRIRSLLSLPPQDPERAEELYPLVATLCRPGPDREAFFRTARWSVGQGTETQQLTAVLAVDVFEYAATACARTQPDGALDFLQQARSIVPDDPHVDVLIARLSAALDRFEEAEAAAQAARDKGSNHAIALLANIQARTARNARIGYEPGMLDEALATVSVEPTGKWQAIDLSALLATRARLLNERALWESGDERQKTLLEMRVVYGRLSKAPFVRSMRQRALDELCFDTPLLLGADDSFCRRAAEEFAMLGGGALSGLLPREVPDADRTRAEGLKSFARKAADLPRGATVVVVFRGDEAELIEWGRPAAEVLARLESRHPRWAVLDRAASERGSAVVTRVLTLAGIEPATLVAAPRSALVSPCFAALVAGREAPSPCPIGADSRSNLERAAPAQMVVLVGRDLDAELSDFQLYELPTFLLSFRKTEAKTPPDGWFKSLSDVWFIYRPPAG